MARSASILDVRGLTVSILLPDGARANVVDDVSFAIPNGGTLGLVGESGSGKTMTSLAIMGLLPRAARVEAGEILFDGEDLLRKTPGELQRLRGRRIAMVLQDPMTALDPSFTIRSQLSDPLQQHRKLKGRELDEQLVAALEQVQLSAAKERLNQYPHQLSGGMRQRVTSAISLAGGPRLLIADEPTTALDATTQARYLQLLRQLQAKSGFALLLVAHDLMVVRHVCERVHVMYSSQVVEEGRVDDVFASPQHPYTQALLGAVPLLGETIRLESIEGQAPDPSDVTVGCRFAPRCKFARDVCRTDPPALTPRGDDRRARCFGTEPGGWIDAWTEQERVAPIEVATDDRQPPNAFVQIRDLRVSFEINKGILSTQHAEIVAVDGVNLSIARGRTLGLVGGTGSGKSTIAHTVMGMVPLTSGSVVVDGHDVGKVKGRERAVLRRLVQVVLQDPYSSLDPRLKIRDIIAEPLSPGRRRRSERAVIQERVAELLGLVGLRANRADRYPHQFSGGQRQRIAIARALAPRPQLIVLDEPTSALDVSVRAQILSLLKRLQEQLGVTYLIISHDLVTVAYLASDVAVMHLGRIVEVGPTKTLYRSPRHPYTLELLASTPGASAAFLTQPRPTGTAADLPPGACRFAYRCALRTRLGNPDRCIEEDPALLDVGRNHKAACHFPEEVASLSQELAQNESATA
jgi:peptide/nickel transport system ATP-binding protein